MIAGFCSLAFTLVSVHALSSGIPQVAGVRIMRRMVPTVVAQHLDSTLYDAFPRSAVARAAARKAAARKAMADAAGGEGAALFEPDVSTSCLLLPYECAATSSLCAAVKSEIIMTSALLLAFCLAGRIRAMLQRI